MKPLRSLPFVSLFALAFFACKTTPPSSTARPDASRESLDWAGTYRGTTPCADCGGIETVVTLDTDRTYTVKRRYLGKETAFREARGTFDWNADGRQITLRGDNGTMFLVGENRLVQLDRAGRRIGGTFADRYVLAKTPDTQADSRLSGTYWKLLELYGQPVTAANGQKEPHLILQDSTNRVSGNGGCNGLMGRYELGPGNRIRFMQLASTMMACPDMTTETQFKKALETADSYALRGDTLVLNRARMAPLARLVAGAMR